MRNGVVESQGRSRPQRDAGGEGAGPGLLSVPRTAAGVLFAIGVIVLAAWLLSMVLGGLGYAMGLAGTPGTFTAARCPTTGVGRTSTRVCAGTFTSADGRIVDTSAHITNARVDVGKPIGLRRKADGGYTQPGWTNSALDLAAAFAILAGAACSLVVPCVMTMRVAASEVVPAGATPRPRGPLLSVLVSVFAISTAVAALSFFAAIVFLLGGLVAW